MGEVELFTFGFLLVAAFIVTTAYAVYCLVRFRTHQKGLRALIPLAALMAWFVITVIALAAIYVLLMAHSQRDTVLMMLRAIGIGYPILGIGFMFVLWSLNKRSNPAMA